MTGLERTSPRPTEGGRLRHPPRQHLPRHPHGTGFAALVLSGGYVEAGDTGRHLMAPGQVLLHRAWESHLDRVDRRGAEVLVLPLAANDLAPAAAHVGDPDAIVRLAERDRRAAAELLLADLTPKAPCAGDWPDLLALAMCADPSLSLSGWAAAWGLHVGSLSRGFRQVFGLTPVGYRLAQRTRRAIDAVAGASDPLSRVALDCGFADQAHMSRAIARLTQATPTALRRAARA